MADQNVMLPPQEAQSQPSCMNTSGLQVSRLLDLQGVPCRHDGFTLGLLLLVAFIKGCVGAASAHVRWWVLGCLCAY